MADTQEIQPLKSNELVRLALNADINQFKALSVVDQAKVIAVSKKIMDKLKRQDVARRIALQETLPTEGIVGDDFSVKWQDKAGKWLLDEKKLMEIYPDKVRTIKTIDPIFAEDYLTRAKKKKSGEPLLDGVSYVCGEGKQMVVRIK